MRLARLSYCASRIVLCTLVVVAGIAIGGPTAAETAGVAATITAVEGPAEVIHPGAKSPVTAREGMRVMPGSIVRTKSNGRIELQFDDRSLLRLNRDTEIRILSGPQERGVLVTLGKLWAKVQSVFGASKFKIKTPAVVAGVRGTIVRAEVTEDESTIAVDEGEVEVTADGEKPVILKKNHEVRRRRGARGLSPNRFDPEARQKWEFWTDPLVQQHIQSIEEAAAASKQACAEVRKQTHDTFQALAVDTAAVNRLWQRVRHANGLVAFVQVSAKGPAPPRPRGSRRPGRRPSRKPPSKRDLIAVLDQAGTIYGECAPLIARGRQAMQQHTAELEDLREALAAQQQANQDLREKLIAFRRQREVDPHWQMFRQHHERSEEHRDSTGKSLGECAPLLKRDVPDKLGDDPKGLKSIQTRFAWGFRKLAGLEQQITKGQAEVQRLRGALHQGAPGPVKPGG